MHWKDPSLLTHVEGPEHTLRSVHSSISANKQEQLMQYFGEPTGKLYTLRLPLLQIISIAIHCNNGNIVFTYAINIHIVHRVCIGVYVTVEFLLCGLL